MSKKLKQYSIPLMYLGFQPNYSVCAYTKKEACSLLGVEMYHLTKYCSIYEPKTKECIDNPHKVYACIESGEFLYIHKELMRVNLPVEELHSLLDAHRKLYPTYQHMLDKLKLE